MARMIKLIWDFRGPDAQQTALHHCVHLKEYAGIEKLPFHEINTTLISDYYSLAYIIVDEVNMLLVRDALKPHRGEVAQ